MAVHVAEVYAAMVAQRRQVFAALHAADPGLLVHAVPGLEHGSILETLLHCAWSEQQTIGHTLRRGEQLDPGEFVLRYCRGALTLEAIEAGWARVAAEMRAYIGTEKPYELVFPRRDLGEAGGTPELVLWGVVMHEMGHLGELGAAARHLGLDYPDLAPIDHLRRNPELGRWWMAEQY